MIVFVTRGRCELLPLMVGKVEIPLVVDFESEVWVPALPLLLRFLYSAIASASRSRTREAIGDKTEAGFIGGKLRDDIDPDWIDGIGDTAEKECE